MYMEINMCKKYESVLGHVVCRWIFIGENEQVDKEGVNTFVNWCVKVDKFD